jgi:alpha-tubulin suppressor-like RCC1 family protein
MLLLVASHPRSQYSPIGWRALSTIYSRGCGVFGALALENNLQDATSFQPLSWESYVNDPKDRIVMKISAGWGHSTALTAGGNLYVWGRPYDFSTLMRLNNINRISSFFARLAAKSSNSSIFGSSEKQGYFANPRIINLNQGKVISVSASAGLTAYLTEDGIVYCFGLNRWQQCGITSKTVSGGSAKKIDSSEMHVYQPVRVRDVPPCKKIDTGLQHCLALSTNGDVFSWGKGSKGQLGHISSTTEPSDITSLARKVPILDSRGRAIKIKDISAGFSYSAAISEDGSVFVWGKGMSEREKPNGSGIGMVKVFEDQFTPRLLKLPDQRKAKEICSR